MLNLDFSIHDRVVLQTFHNTHVPTRLVWDHENYWQLLGKTGIVISIDVIGGMPIHEKGKRVLVQFDESINELGLACHNEKANSLWIFVTDLKLISNDGC